MAIGAVALVLGIGSLIVGGAEIYEGSQNAQHENKVAQEQADHEAQVAAALQAQAQIDANNAVADAALAGQEAVANTVTQNAIVQEQAQGAWNRQEAQAGIQSQTLGMTLGGMQIQEQTKESAARASTAANGLTFSGSAAYKMLAMQDAEQVAYDYTQSQGQAIITGIERDADLQLKTAEETEALNLTQSQQYAAKQTQAAAEYSQDVLAKAALGVSEAAWQGQMQVSQAQWQGNQDVSNAWLSAFAGVVNAGSSLMEKYLDPTPKQQAATAGGWQDSTAAAPIDVWS